MCLTIKDRQVKIAEADLVVYKNLEKREDLNWSSPYFPEIWQVGETKITSCGFEDLRVIPSHIRNLDLGFHSYSTLEAAKFWSHFGYYICKMFIPKGAVFVLGYDSEIVSSALRFDKVLEEVTKRSWGDRVITQFTVKVSQS